jgi:ligand-binding SRPBCC domain-containing protein
MFGAVTMSIPNQQENIPPNLVLNPNDKTINENNEETMVIDTVQYQLPSTENIAQHRHQYFIDQTTKAKRTGAFFSSRKSFSFIFAF